jgi:hypothetical protein
MRNLTRTGDAIKALRVARQVLLAFLLRLGVATVDRPIRAMRISIGLLILKCPILLNRYLSKNTSNAAVRVDRLTKQIQELYQTWEHAAMVKALQALRGVSLIVAVTTISTSR